MTESEPSPVKKELSSFTDLKAFYRTKDPFFAPLIHDTFSDLERQVIDLRFGREEKEGEKVTKENKELKVKEVASQLNITRGRVRRIEKDFPGKLRNIYSRGSGTITSNDDNPQPDSV